MLLDKDAHWWGRKSQCDTVNFRVLITQYSAQMWTPCLEHSRKFSASLPADMNECFDLWNETTPLSSHIFAIRIHCSIHTHTHQIYLLPVKWHYVCQTQSCSHRHHHAPKETEGPSEACCCFKPCSKHFTTSSKLARYISSSVSLAPCLWYLFDSWQLVIMRMENIWRTRLRLEKWN